MKDRAARTTGIQTGIVLAGLIGIGAGVAIGATAPTSDGGRTRNALGAIVLVVSAFALGAAGMASLRATRNGEALREAAPTRHDPASARGSGSDLERLRAEREAARLDLDALHAALSHGLRSPIGAVINFTTVLEEDCGDALGGDGRALLARIGRSARSALALVDGLARLSAVSRHELTPQRIDPEGLVRDSFRAIAPADRSLEFSVAAPLPSVIADADLLRVAFDELLANAIQFTARREKPRITVGGRREAESVVYWVEDNGVGFDARHADRIFRPFERLHRQEEFPGAGVGLAIVRRVAERHGGSAEGEADAERGARFRLALPSATDGLS